MMGAQPFRRDRRGVSVVEFALALPLVLLIGIGGIELMTFTLAHQKAERIASVTADAIARNTLAPSERTFVDTLDAAEAVGAPFAVTAEERTIVTGVIAIKQNGKIVNKIAWQRCAGALGGVASTLGAEWTATPDYADGPSITLPQGMTLLQNQMVVISEVAIRYRPLVMVAPIPGAPADGIIRQRSLFVARGQAFPYITPSPDVEAARCS